MRRSWLPALAFLLFANGALAQFYVETDLNGVVGDPQPDYVVTTVGQDVTADIWIFASPNLTCSVFGIQLCNYDHALGYNGSQYYPYGAGWGCVPVAPPDSQGCVLLQCADFVFAMPMALPYRVATVTYLAAVDHSIADVTLGQISAVMTLPSLSTFGFLNNGEVIARIQIGDVTATETASWGSVKSLFR